MVFVSKLEDELVAIIPHLRAYARILCRSHAHADDLVQDAIERALSRRAQFRAGSSLKAWVFRILRNKFTDDVRAARRMVADIDGEAAARQAYPPEQLWRLQYADLLAAVERLAQPTREAILLVMGAGLTHQEAALACGCPLGTLKSRVRRAKLVLLETVDLDIRSEA